MNDYTRSNINAANHALTCPRAEASILAKMFAALERQLKLIHADPTAIRRARMYTEAFEARAKESTL